MPVNKLRIEPIIDTDRAKKFHRDEKPKKLVKRYDEHSKNCQKYDGKSFSEILNDEWQRKNNK